MKRLLPGVAVTAFLLAMACSSPRSGHGGPRTEAAKPVNPRESVVAALTKSASADTFTAHETMHPAPDNPAPRNAWATAVVSRPDDAVYFSGDYSAIFTYLFGGIKPDGVNEEIILLRNATLWRVDGPAAERLRHQVPNVTDRSWVRTPRDPSDVSEFTCAVTSFTEDPRELSGFEAQAVDAVLDLGPEPVDGTPMHHYAAKLDEQKWSDAIVARYPEPQQGSEYSIAAVMPTEFNVWITDSGYVGRASGVSDRELITQDFTGYGQPVSIPMPKADDIVNAPR